MTTQSATPPQEGLQTGAVGTGQVVFMILAAAAPIAAVVGVMPIAVALGNGPGYAGSLLVASAVLLLFAVGYAAMSRHVRNAGAFYSYVAQGAGGVAGAGAGFVALIAYNAVAVALSAAFAFFAHSTFDSLLHVDLPWEAWWAIGLALVALLSVSGVALTAKVLGVALVFEVVILLVFDVAVLAEHGIGSFSLDVFAPATVFGGAAGIALMYAFTSFIGLEAAALYSEETKVPERTIGRATYIALAVVGLFYTGTTWAAISAYGTDQAQAAAAADPASFVFAANFAEVGSFSTDVMQVLVVTSLFAGFLAFHQAAARYLFGIARDGLLPRALTATHRRRRTPHVAGAVQLAVVVLVVGGLALAGDDPYLEISAPILGLGTLGIILLQAAAAASAIAYFRRRRDPRAWTTVVAPGLAVAGLVTSAVLAIDHFGTLTGSQSDVVGALPWLYAGALAAGVAAGLWLRARRPQAFAALGRGGAPPPASTITPTKEQLA